MMAQACDAGVMSQLSHNLIFPAITVRIFGYHHNNPSKKILINVHTLLVQFILALKK